VWPLYLLAMRFGGRHVAMFTSVLFTCSNYHYGFAHEVRAYALFTLLTTTGMWLLVRATQRPEQGIKLMLHLSMLNVVLVYTHFFGWLVVGLQGLLVFLLPEMRPLRRGFLFGAVMTLCWFMPYGFIFLERMTQSVGQGTWLEAPVPEELYNMVWRWSNAPVLAVTFLALLVAALWKDRSRSPGIRFALVWAFVPLLGMFAVSRTGIRPVGRLVRGIPVREHVCAERHDGRARAGHVGHVHPLEGRGTAPWPGGSTGAGMVRRGLLRGGSPPLVLGQPLGSEGHPFAPAANCPAHGIRG
jgi:hypothetical protein